MKQLSVSWPDLEQAFENSFAELHYFFDQETGLVILVADEIRWQLETIYKESNDTDTGRALDLMDVLSGLDLPEWEQHALLEADHVKKHWGLRVIDIPQIERYEAYADMEAFIDTVRTPHLQDQLRQAIQGRGAFGRFRRVLVNYLIEQKRWSVFQQNRRRKQILAWLAEHDIEPIDVPLPAEVNMAELREQRQKLLAEVFIFTRAASRLPGIVKIALIGSLTTIKLDPKDADLLVTITNDVDLAGLAASGRKLKGHAQHINRGGDVFLADPQNHYLGRTCPWKRCGPGIRASCDPLHCGQRTFLHDDLEDIRLSTRLIAQPPLELWPKIVTRVPVPDDVAELVLRPLQQDI